MCRMLAVQNPSCMGVPGWVPTLPDAPLQVIPMATGDNQIQVLIYTQELP